jgi:hypothetical protein
MNQKPIEQIAAEYHAYEERAYSAKMRASQKRGAKRTNRTIKLKYLDKVPKNKPTKETL